MKSNKIILWTLLSLVLFETIIISVGNSQKDAEIIDLKNQIAGYASSTPQLLKNNEDLFNQNKELREANLDLAKDNEEYVQTNAALAKMCIKYCPPNTVVPLHSVKQ